MKKILFISLIMVAFYSTSIRSEEPVSSETRSLPQELLAPLKSNPKTFVQSLMTSRPVYLGKAALGAFGALFCGAMCVKGATVQGLETLADPGKSFALKTGALSVMLCSFFGLAECSGYSLTNAQKALLPA